MKRKASSKATKGISPRPDAERRVRQCERLARLFQLVRLITSSGKYDANALAKELGCSTRTIFRLLQTLGYAGIPWYLDPHHKSYKVREGFRLSGLEELGEKKKVSKNAEQELAREKLIAAGENLANSLDLFLKTLKTS